MNIIAGVVSAGIGIWIMIQTRKWFFETDENFWESFGNKSIHYWIFPKRSHAKYQKYWNDKSGQLTVITWLMTGTLSSLLSYALLNLLFF